jgi:uncharacterized integral membrane protein (TIGR00697 family)
MFRVQSFFQERSEPLKVSFWFVVIASVFVTCLITANIIAVKLILLFGFLVPAGIIVFPLSYLFGDILTEVYGYAAARRVIWLGFACNLVAVLAIYIGGIAPAAPFWQGQTAYDTILGFTPRLLLASFVAYLVGEFTNSFVLARLKIATKGRWLWTRTIGSTLIGEGLDTLIFITIAFWGIIPAPLMLTAVLTQWIFKVSYEIIATPFTYLVVGFLKRRENLDTYDYHTNFSPILIRKAVPEKV